MRLQSRRQLNVEGLETRTLLAADVCTFIDSDAAVVEHGHKQNGAQASDIRSSALNVDASEAKQNAASTIRLTPTSSFGLAEAIANVGPHGTVIVEAGVYSESSIMITDPVTIVGEEGAVIEFDSNSDPTGPWVVDAGFHVKNTQQVRIQGLEIRDNDTGSTAILIEGSDNVTIEDNQIATFQFGVLVESGDHTKIRGNVVSSQGVVGASFGILVVNGFGNQVRDNTVSGAFFGLFASGEGGKLLNNTASDNYVGVILCNLTTGIELPGGRFSASQVPATRWLVQGNTSTNNGSVGYLVIDGANHNVLTNNRAGDNRTYDIELTALTNRFGLTELPASYDNIVNMGSYKDITIEDNGNDNKVHGGG